MNTVVLINGRVMGRGEDELGAVIMGSFLSKAAALGDLQAIAFYNTGVTLLAEGSAVLQQLTALDERGVDLLACGTCVTHFGLNDKIKVGLISTMDEIIALMKRAEKVITL